MKRTHFLSLFRASACDFSFYMLNGLYDVYTHRSILLPIGISLKIGNSQTSATGTIVSVVFARSNNPYIFQGIKDRPISSTFFMKK